MIMVLERKGLKNSSIFGRDFFSALLTCCLQKLCFVLNSTGDKDYVCNVCDEKLSLFCIVCDV